MSRLRTWPGRHAAFLHWLLLEFTLLALLAFAFLEISWEAGQAGPRFARRPAHIMVVHLPVRILILGMVLGAWVLLARTTLRAWRTGRRGFAVLALIVIGLVAPVSGLSHCAHNVLLWQTLHSAQAPDGRTFYFMDSSFLQGQRLCLTELERSGLLTRRMWTVTCTNGDYPRHRIWIVRPADDAREHEDVAAAEPDLSPVLRADNECYLAFDRVSGETFSRSRLNHLSPFVCLGEHDHPSGRDVEKVIEASGRFVHGDLPGAGAVHLGRQHPNPDVRALARGLPDQRFPPPDDDL